MSVPFRTKTRLNIVIFRLKKQRNPHYTGGYILYATTSGPMSVKDDSDCSR
jgi:hypothetical protein